MLYQGANKCSQTWKQRWRFDSRMNKKVKGKKNQSYTLL